jgi:hypothetical protein
MENVLTNWEIDGFVIVTTPGVTGLSVEICNQIIILPFRAEFAWLTYIKKKELSDDVYVRL